MSSVTDHVGAQDSGTKTADFDDDDGGGLVSLNNNLIDISTIVPMEFQNMCVFGTCTFLHLKFDNFKVPSLF